MSIKILTKNSIDNTNIDGARQNHFSAGMRSGIVRGAFNEGRFFATASNIIALDTCELRISGHQVIIDSLEAITLSDSPSTPTKYSMIAEIQVSDMSVPSFRLFIQPASVGLRQENLFKTNNGSGTYQLRIGNFTLGTTGLITDVIRTADIITGGGEGGIADIKFNATATQLSSSSQPTANIDYNEETKEYDAHFGIPAGSGTDVTIGGIVQKEWSADFVENEKAISGENNSNPITHNDDAPVVFAESERQKSKNLFNKEAITKGVELVGDTGEIRTAELYWVSEYIDIQGMSALYCSGTRTSGTSFCYYSEDKTFISTQRMGEWVGQLTPPTNAVYLRFNGLLTELDDIQLEKGTVATDYQPYNGAIVHEKEIADVEHYEVVYDKETGKTTLGGNDYGGGILGGVRVENLDLSKYKKLKIYVKFNLVYSSYLHDLAIPNSQGTCMLSSSNTEIMCIKASTNINKTVFEINEIGYFLTTFTSKNGNDTYYVYRIEGVY